MLEPAYYTAEVFLGSDRRLVELSSITVFPGAESQPFHPDETNPETSLLSVFVNLAATHRAAGALRVIPHSHLTSSEVVRAHSSFDESRAEVLELPAGSATFMNSKLVHSGGANTSRDRIRAVLYFTFGKPGLRGPAYSILPDVEDLKLSLEAFSPRAGLRRDGWTQESKPRLHEGYKLTRGFPETIHSAKVYLVDEFDEIVRGIELDPPDEWIAVVLRDVSSHGGHWTARNLAEHANVDVGMVLQALGTLGRDGWLSW
ncbi:MAG TPA: phytanoyl-CoA dioxygenase family protein [Candidatus Polarisedimenticolaceae bacterium]|nr:phytanoyl-CoA dioxygenase family protein [Candidatus Polarisedimenticolaceae bacterium]